ncbi:MAG TPA: FAD-dependent oxidoreductase [Agriterribacter sp.]|nr:FAD-dependent oxidoreductase [Agriterribacter sp.]
MNGTTGYEEAACQGLIAGMNAHLSSRGKDPFMLKRSDAYIGVLIDDLISKGTEEPYRMFTSRAEFRTLLRQDNADLRLTEKSYRSGLASAERMKILEKKQNDVNHIINIINSLSIEPTDVNTFLTTVPSTPIMQKQKAAQLLLRPGIGLDELQDAVPRLSAALGNSGREALEEAEIQIKYNIYIEKEKELVSKMSKLEDLAIPENFNYSHIAALSTEARQKFISLKPRTLGQASRISGVNPSDVQILMVYMGR